jgi:hypothetical protein
VIEEKSDRNVSCVTREVRNKIGGGLFIPLGGLAVGALEIGRVKVT